MRKTITISSIILLFCLVACGNAKKVEKKVPIIGTIKLSDENKLFCISALNQYLLFDSLNTDKAEETANYIESNVLNENRDSDSKGNFYRKNIDSTTIIIKQATVLLEKGWLNEVVKLLDSNINNFHGHPANTLEVENDFHIALYILYNACYPPKEAIKRAIKLEEFTKFHYQTLESFSGKMNPRYLELLNDLAELYCQAEEHPKAIEILKERLSILNKLTEKDSEDYLNTLQKLIDYSEQAGYSEQSKKYTKELKQLHSVCNSSIKGRTQN